MASILGQAPRIGRGFGAIMAHHAVFQNVIACDMAVYRLSNVCRIYRADQGGAALSSSRQMVAALQRLGGAQSSTLPDRMAAFGISGKTRSLFSSHPSIEQRIKALQQ